MIYLSPSRIAIGVVGLLIATWFVWPGDRTYPITNATPTAGTQIIAFGDSLTEGVGSLANGYVEQLASRLNITIINKGVRGDTTAAALQRLDRDVLDQDPRIVLVGLGGNDMLRRVPIDEAFANLEQIVTRIQDRGALVIILALDGVLMVGGGFEERYRDLAERLGCPIVPDLLGDVIGQRKLMADSVHPNQAGYSVIVDKIVPVLEAYIAGH